MLQKLITLFYRGSALILDLSIMFIIPLIGYAVFGNSSINIISSLAGIIFFLQRDIWISPGKQLFGLEMKNSFSKKEPSIAKGFIRSIVLLIPGVIVVDVILILFRSDNKRLGDLITETETSIENCSPAPVIIWNVIFLLIVIGLTYLYYTKAFVFETPQQFIKQ